MFDDDISVKMSAEFPRELEQMSIEEIKKYIAEMREEIERAENDIKAKQASLNAADSFFKS